jgi:hypothetical protein
LRHAARRGRRWRSPERNGRGCGSRGSAERFLESGRIRATELQGGLLGELAARSRIEALCAGDGLAYMRRCREAAGLEVTN